MAVKLQGKLKELFGDRTVLFDGAMGTMLYDRGVFINKCYDELNLTQGELVRSVHEEYLQAGAEIIETNTFGANRIRLQRHGLQDQVAPINAAGVKLARQAVDQLRDKQAGDAWVAASIGSLGVKLQPEGELTTAAAYAAYAEQIKALVAAGPDLLVIETLMSLAEAEQALLAARAEAPTLPVLVFMTVDDAGNCLDGTIPAEAAKKLAAWGADAIGCNCSTGPEAVLAAVQAMQAAGYGVGSLPIGAMPNAGVPRAVEGRAIYLSSPEYMASYARKFVKAGAQFIGGCCGTTPNHIRAMKSSLRALNAMAAAPTAMASAAAEITESTIQPPPLKDRSRLGHIIATGEFLTLVEIVSPKGIDCSKEIAGAAMLHKLGVHGVNVPDSPRASARMSAQSLCIQIQQQVGIETLLHYTCRDRNLLSIQSDLIGASSIGLKNVLCLTGDPPKLGNYPDATAVFDVDAIGLVKIVGNLNHGIDIGKNSIGASTGFTIGVAANPGVPDIENELRRFRMKVEAGGEYAITQPVFDLKLLHEFLDSIEASGHRIPVVAGIWPLTSLKNAEFMKNDLKVSMPDAIMKRMAEAGSPEESRAEGIRIAQEMLLAVRDRVQGVQVSAPFGKYTSAAQVLGPLWPLAEKV